MFVGLIVRGCLTVCVSDSTRVCLTLIVSDSMFVWVSDSLWVTHTDSVSVCLVMYRCVGGHACICP